MGLNSLLLLGAEDRPTWTEALDNSRRTFLTAMTRGQVFHLVLKVLHRPSLRSAVWITCCATAPSRRIRNRRRRRFMFFFFVGRERFQERYQVVSGDSDNNLGAPVKDWRGRRVAT